ncbi:unnamed protein product [Vitrella brassicaformis CCMP3155]|uniref:Uncharacterized protein n=1 Tax=Vitrella brassicaformis (strain CCMP3155) TaxID=1169540 RepID=A0A0G4EIU6_VITBC|nr:unnamed protein product [Vitrella brassicaformis CCMP3155]|eukprot:CEL95827.1 unnamed protein product [Vitrella brassicaformis CCMP3155]
MDSTQGLKDQAAAVGQSLARLQQLCSQVGSCLSQIGQLDQSNLTAAEVTHIKLTPASSGASLQLQLSLLGSHFDASIAQLSTAAPVLSTAVGALTATTTTTSSPAAAAAAAAAPAVAEETNHEPEARRCLSRDALSNVFGHLQPWELTPIRPALGTSLFTQSAANYSHISIDYEDGHSRRMWEAMPIPVAHKWGERATSIRQLKHRYPRGLDYARKWCRGTWVSLVEGHAGGRAALAAAKEKSRQQGGDGAAAAAAAVDGGDKPSDDEGTLEVLTFEDVGLHHSSYIPNPPPSSDLPPVPSAPVRLPALTTVKDIPNECAAARVGRSWQTPNVKTFSHSCGLSSGRNGFKAWLADCCETIEVLTSGYRGTAMVASAVSELPAGRSLSALHTLQLDLDEAEDTDMLREALVAKGVLEKLRSAVQLRDAIAQPAALSEPTIDWGGGHGQTKVKLLSGTTEPAVQKVLAHLAKTAATLTYDGHDEPHPAPISDDTFPAAHEFRLRDDALATEDKKRRAIEVASHMPNLTTISAAHVQVHPITQHGVLTGGVGPLSKPWELTPIRPALGTSLFTQSAANYSHISIDYEDGHSRRMWEAMPIPVAHKWGERATSIRQLKHRYPRGLDYARKWCRGTWVSLVEGHAGGRAALAAAKEKSRQQGGDGAAAAAAAVDGGDKPSDDEGTLEVLTFEDVGLDRSSYIPNPPPSSDLPPVPSAPVRLPALTTVKDIPNEYAAARVGRNWRTPNVKAFSHSCRLFSSGNGVKAWLADCSERLEVLISNGTAMVASPVSELPDGRSLSALHTLHLELGGAEDTDKLREALVARGVRRQLRSLRLTVWPVWFFADAHGGDRIEKLRRAVQLRDAVAQPAALSEPTIDWSGGYRLTKVELLSGTTEPAVHKVLAHFTKTATTVTYDGHDEPHPAPITDDTFSAAHELILGHGALATEDKKRRAIEVASHMPNLTTISAATVGPLFKVWGFLEGLQSEWVSRGEGERSVGKVSLELTSAGDLAAELKQGSRVADAAGSQVADAAASPFL